MNDLIEYLKNNKEKFLPKKKVKQSNHDSWVNSETGTWWPSSWEEVEVSEFDFEALLNQIDVFSSTFKEK